MMGRHLRIDPYTGRYAQPSHGRLGGWPVRAQTQIGMFTHSGETEAVRCKYFSSKLALKKKGEVRVKVMFSISEESLELLIRLPVGHGS